MSNEYILQSEMYECYSLEEVYFAKQNVRMLFLRSINLLIKRK